MTVPSDCEDRDAIRELIARYCFLIDRLRDADGIIALFTPDGSWEGLGLGRLQGAELRAFMARAMAETTVYRHLAFNEVIDIDGDRASARNYLLVLRMTDGKPSVSLTGYYEDELVRTPEGWRFASRLVAI